MTQKTCVSGPLLFLRFIFPCMKYRLFTGKMEQGDFDALKRHVRNNTDPEIPLLEKCAPDAVRDLRACSRLGNKKVWSYGAVYKYWLYRHGSSDDCVVKIGEVHSRLSAGISVVIDGEPATCSNTYRLELERGDRVMIHHRVIVAKKMERRRV